MSDTESSEEETLGHDEELYLAFADERRDVPSAFTGDDDDDDDDDDNDDDSSGIDGLSFNFVGGAPQWLTGAPSDAQVQCTRCAEVPMTQLVQLYAPLDDEHAFHRVLHVFACPACGSAFRLLRSQLTKGEAALPETAAVCFCGLPARKQCAKCTDQSYCSRAHQKLDWPRHKLLCGIPADQPIADLPPRPTALPRIKFATELELSAAERLRIRRRQDANFLAKHNIQRSNAAAGGDGDGGDDDDSQESLAEADLDEAVGDSKASRDELFARFQRRIAADPEQLLRYWHWDGTGDLFERGDAQVLWATSTAPQTSAAAVPPCEHCGAKRNFEFQIMPQLLYYVSKNNAAATANVDFATLVCYTCSASCKPPTTYTAEHIHVQKFAQS
jgi:pre-rRNA-processing protein TSR4